MSEQDAYLLTSMLQDVMSYGTGGRANFGRPAAGKTGTTNDYKDAWFVGYTPDLAAGVWVGFDDMRRSLGRGEVGGRAAAPIWSEFMKHAGTNGAGIPHPGRSGPDSGRSFIGTAFERIKRRGTRIFKTGTSRKTMQPVEPPNRANRSRPTTTDPKKTIQEYREKIGFHVFALFSFTL